jgi:ABC-type uncharacterized transport system involved in gliding motility auxiliary subunit
MRTQYAKAAGWSGLALLFFTGVTYSIRGIADLWLWLPLALGLGLAGWWLSEFKAEAWLTLRSRKTRQGANAVVFSLAVLAIAVLIQALAAGNDVSADLTKNKAFTLADETVRTVKGLEQKVEVLAFYGDENKAQYEDLLKRVKRVNPADFDYRFVNLNREPLLAQQYGVHSLGTSVLVAGDQTETVSGAREEDLLNGLVKLGSGAKKELYFLAGHQERAIDDSSATGVSGLKQGLESSSFDVRPLNLGTTADGKVPSDAAALVVAGPRTDLLAPELQALTQYLAQGGRLLVAVDPRVPVPGLTAWLAKAGVILGQDIVIDINPFSQLYGASPLAPIIQAFDPQHAITKDLLEQHGQAIFPQTRSLALAAKLPDGAVGTALAKTLPSAFGWTGKGTRAPSRAGAGDNKGPVALMVSVELPLKAFGGDAAATDKQARVVALGSSVVLDNQGVSAFNNQDLVINSLRWLSGEEKRIALAPKEKDDSPLLLDRGRLLMVWWTFILMALGALGMGVLVTLRRRREA